MTRRAIASVDFPAASDRTDDSGRSCRTQCYGGFDGYALNLEGGLISAEERSPHTGEVLGSIPKAPTIPRFTHIYRADARSRSAALLSPDKRKARAPKGAGDIGVVCGAARGALLRYAPIRTFVSCSIRAPSL